MAENDVTPPAGNDKPPEGQSPPAATQPPADQYKPHAWQAQCAGDGKNDIDMKPFDTIDKLRVAYKELAKSQTPLPKAPEEYKLPALPEGMERDENMEKWFRGASFKAKLPQSAVEALFSAWNEKQKLDFTALENEATETRKANGKALADHYGGTEKVNEALALAQTVVKQFGDESYVKELSPEFIADNPGFVKMLAKIGKAISSDRIVTGQPASQEPKPTGPAAIYTHPTSIAAMQKKQAQAGQPNVTDGWYPTMAKK